MKERLFSFSELWWPFICEHEGCNEITNNILLSQSDQKQLPEINGPIAADYILNNNLGRAVCSKHQYKKINKEDLKMELIKFIKKTKPVIVQSLKIEINGFDNVVKEIDDYITLFEYEGDWAIYLGECNMWHWIAPISTLKAVKVDDSALEVDEFEISVSELMHQIW